MTPKRLLHALMAIRGQLRWLATCGLDARSVGKAIARAERVEAALLAALQGAEVTA